MNLKTTIATSALCMTIIASCSQKEISLKVNNPLTIHANINTRAFGTNWEHNDQIGVFMSQGDENLITNNLFTNTEANGAAAAFSSTTPVYFPTSGNVSILTYYPYQADVTSTSYPINITNQTDLTNIDLMTAKKTEVISSESAVDVTFSHKLSLINIKVGVSEGLTASDLEDLTAKIDGLIPTGTYNLTDDTFTYGEVSSTAINMNILADGTIAQAIIIPKDDQSLTITLTLKNGKTNTATLSATNFEAGKKYSYTANFSKTDLTISSNNITDWTAGNEETPLF